MRGTPPSRRMSAGTRSSAITATAPASSAMRACSASTTSMITPPLSISARPVLTLRVPISIAVSLDRTVEAIEQQRLMRLRRPVRPHDHDVGAHEPEAEDRRRQREAAHRLHRLLSILQALAEGEDQVDLVARAVLPRAQAPAGRRIPDAVDVLLPCRNGEVVLAQAVHHRHSGIDVARVVLPSAA